MEIAEALTFDDVLLVPAESDVLPSQTDLRTRLTRELELGTLDVVSQEPKSSQACSQAQPAPGS